MFTTLTLIGRSIYGLANEVVCRISVNNSTCPPAHDYVLEINPFPLLIELLC